LREKARRRRQVIQQTGLRIVHDPSPAQFSAGQHCIGHPPDAPILLAFMQAEVDYLMTLNCRRSLASPFALPLPMRV
jgi:hypothetical protein